MSERGRINPSYLSLRRSQEGVPKWSIASRNPSNLYRVPWLSTSSPGASGSTGILGSLSLIPLSVWRTSARADDAGLLKPVALMRTTRGPVCDSSGATRNTRACYAKSNLTGATRPPNLPAASSASSKPLFSRALYEPLAQPRRLSSAFVSPRRI